MQKISFECDAQKALEAMLWVISRKAEGFNLYNLLKVIFHADCYHLNHYARPVTGDVYIAMTYGTVPKFIYDLINKEELALCKLGLNEDGLPFYRQGYNLIAKRSLNADLLSESDIEALEEGLKEYGDLSFEAVERKNHAHPAWEKTFRETPYGSIAFEDLITDDEIREDFRSLPTLHMGL